MFSKKDIRTLIFPLMMEQFLVVMVGMVDTLMISGAGESAVSGVSLVDSVNFMLSMLFSGLAAGGSIFIAQLLGRREEKEAAKTGAQLLYTSVAAALLVMAAALIGGRRILILLFGSITPQVAQNAQSYFFITAFSYPFLAAYNAVSSMFRSMGNSKTPMLVSVLANFVNIAGNALFIYALQLGAAGAALGTLLSRVLSAVLLLLLWNHGDNPLGIRSLREFKPDFRLIRKIFSLGVPIALENSIFQIGRVLVQSMVSGFGTSAITANAVAHSIISLVQVPGNAIGLALVPVAGQCVGAGEWEQARKYAKQLVGFSYVIMAALGILLFFAGPLAVTPYHLGRETAETAVFLLKYCCVCTALVWPAAFVLPSFLRAAGKVTFTMAVSFLSMWIFRIAFGYLLSVRFQLGVFGVWAAMTADWLCRSVCFIISFAAQKKKAG